MRCLFLGYRDWAIKVYQSIKNNPNISNELPLCTTAQDLNYYNLSEFDLLITCGWSDELNEVADKILSIGVHCASLDRYSYGTPIQLQIIDGIKFTKHRIFKFVSSDNKIRAHTHTREYSHEVDLDISGSMDDILNQMTATSIVLFNMFLDDYPNIKWDVWEEETLKRNPRTPSDSVINMQGFSDMKTDELYDLIRCLGSPYPNLVLEDDVGYLYFEKVRYVKK